MVPNWNFQKGANVQTKSPPWEGCGYFLKPHNVKRSIIFIGGWPAEAVVWVSQVSFPVEKAVGSEKHETRSSTTHKPPWCHESWGESINIYYINIASIQNWFRYNYVGHKYFLLYAVCSQWFLTIIQLSMCMDDRPTYLDEIIKWTQNQHFHTKRE